MTPKPSVVVVVPAHDESAAICSTVESVAVALRCARRRRLIDAVSLQVVAHRCSDDTAMRARSSLQMVRSAEVAEDFSSTSIGQVRDRGARRGLARLGTPPQSTWLLSTDADTRVPRDWVAEILRQAGRHRATAVVGLADLDQFRGHRQAEASYRALVESKMVSGDQMHQHDHVYGANLAIRADVYLAHGGFPHVPHGEDQLLIDTLAAHAVPILRTADIAVTTSGRMTGRAANGLADLLRRLDETDHVSESRAWALHSPSTPSTSGVLAAKE